MSNCLRYAPLIGARPGELTQDEVRALADHLSGCATCAAYAADLAATEGLVSEGLLAQAAQRDFAPFVDQVMARVGAHGKKAHAGVGGWLRRHWRATVATLAPALAALALFLYVRHDAGPQLAQVELSTEGNVTTVLQTNDGPVVLLNDDASPEGG